MKKVLIAALTVIALTACAEGSKPEVKDAPATQAQTQAAEKEEKADTQATENSTQSEAPATEETKATEETPKSEAGLGKVLSFEDFDVVINDVKAVKDYEKKDAVQVSYDFTNKSDKAAAAMSVVSVKVFQDGVELSTAITMSGNDNFMKEVKSGSTVKNVLSAFTSDKEAGPLTIQVEPLFSFDEGNMIEFEVPYPSK